MSMMNKYVYFLNRDIPIDRSNGPSIRPAYESKKNFPTHEAGWAVGKIGKKIPKIGRKSCNFDFLFRKKNTTLGGGGVNRLKR
jgi:hypothetical protein